MSKLIGQPHILRFIPSLESITQPMLWVGPDGVGKRTYAEELASKIHPTSKRILLSPGVEEIRDLVGWSQTRSFGKYGKIAVVELSRASEASQNALLKLVEEPPAKFRLILISSHLHVLPTITSRCLRFQFYGLSDEDLATVLEQQGYPRATALVAAEFADGSVTRAIHYMTQEESIFEASSLLRLESPADQAEHLLQMRQEDRLAILQEEMIRQGTLTPKMVSVLSRHAGVRARALLALMIKPIGEN